MTLDETIDLLTAAAAFDRRTVGEADALAWHAAVGDLDFADSRAAVVSHYRESRDWIMPADVRGRVKAVRRERLAAAGEYIPPPELLGDPRAYAAAVHAGTVAIADGRDPDEAVRDIARRARRELEAP